LDFTIKAFWPIWAFLAQMGQKGQAGRKALGKKGAVRAATRKLKGKNYWLRLY
jgi:hypothetical protein